MVERLRTLLLIATLMVATAGATAGIMSLKERGDERPTVMIVRSGHAPVEWNGWQLIPPSGTESNDGDNDDSEPMNSGEDNAPLPI